MLYIKNLALIGLLAALAAQARPIAQAQDYDMSEADQQGERSSQGSVVSLLPHHNRLLSLKRFCLNHAPDQDKRVRRVLRPR